MSTDWNNIYFCPSLKVLTFSVKYYDLWLKVVILRVKSCGYWLKVLTFLYSFVTIHWKSLTFAAKCYGQSLNNPYINCCARCYFTLSLVNFCPQTYLGIFTLFSQIRHISSITGSYVHICLSQRWLSLSIYFLSPLSTYIKKTVIMLIWSISTCMILF